MKQAANVPELTGTGSGWIRIPAELDVPVTPRVVAVLDTPAMQRLKRISQLGLVSQVYPGATHSRFEHSLGVYRLACLSLRQLLAGEPALAETLSAADVKTFLLAALLHDIGHWPYCHAIEDMRLPEITRHEQLARSLICHGELAKVISEQWQIEPQQVAAMIHSGRLSTAASGPASNVQRKLDIGGWTVLRNLLDGPLDIDKMDYLQRDSLHAGVPYGRNFDVNRLLSSLCVGRDGASLAITEKGKTAAEMMVFARYVMFSEVYWHHTVRSATAMLQRMVYELHTSADPTTWLRQSDAEFAQTMLEKSASSNAGSQLAQALFGRDGARSYPADRGLYKRLGQFGLAEFPEVFTALARRPYDQLVKVSQALAARLSRGLSQELGPADVLIDAPPVKLEVQFQIEVRRAEGAKGRNMNPRDADGHKRSEARFEPLANLSPVVRALATDQFDNFVKRIRVFVAPWRAAELQVGSDDLAALLLETSQAV